MRKALTLSIIIPVYNEQNHLEKCLKSIEKQSVKPNEVLVIDNNSNDQSVEIAKKFSFVTVLNEKNQGIFYARNKGFNESKCDILARIDADTILPKGWVKKVYNLIINNPKYAITGGGYFYNIPFPKFNGWMQGQIVFRLNRLIVGHYITWGSNMAITKEMWNNVKSKVCARNDIHEDLDIAIHLNKCGYRILYKEKLRVGVEMKRVLSGQRGLWDYLMLWPNTLKSHNINGWIVGWLGAVWLYISRPIIVFGISLIELKDKIIRR